MRGALAFMSRLLIQLVGMLAAGTDVSPLAFPRPWLVSRC
jgi:hypothetical protein